MSRVLNTSTMKSPPLEVWFTGSADGGMVSAAASLGPGGAAFGRGSGEGEAAVLAWIGVLSAAAPAMVAPLRKLRREASGAASRSDLLCLDMAFSPAWT